MRECLKCKKSIEGKNESAKFCSTSCRVMYNRKHGSNSGIKPVQMQVLYNSILGLVDKMGLGDTPLSLVTENRTTRGLVDIVKPPTPLKSFDWYRLAKKDIEDEEDWLKMKTEIENAENLTPKQKNVLLTTNI